MAPPTHNTRSCGATSDTQHKQSWLYQHCASNKMKATQNTTPVTQTHNHVATYVAL